MRDGARLAADVFRPADAGPLPAVLVRTAYGRSTREFAMTDYPRIAAAGFVVVVQDKRGRFDSEGDYHLLHDDGIGEHQDGYDTVEWVAAQPWCSGEVGAFGISYLGQTVLGAATAAPPSLRAAVPTQPSSDEFTDRTFVDGVLSPFSGTWAVLPMVSDDLIAKLPADQRERAEAERNEYLSGLPAISASIPLLDQPFLRLFPQVWGDALLHRDDPGFFAESRFGVEEAARVRVPLLHVGGWFDVFTRNSARQYGLVSEHGHDQHVREGQRLVLGPFSHGGLSSNEVGGRRFPDGAIDYIGLVIEWLGRWLRGEEPSRPDHRVIIYVLGADRWRAEAEWPPPGVSPGVFALGADGGLVPGAGEAGTRTFHYDPEEPYTGGLLQNVGMADLSELHTGDDVLVYTSEPFDREVEFTGSPEAVLHIATTATDADWVVELHAVDEKGSSRLVNEGVARARYRGSRSAPQPVEPGRVEEYVVGMRPMSVQLPAGERLRVVVTAGKYPAYERHPQSYVDLTTVEESGFAAADHTVHSGPDAPSRIVLPVVEPEARGEWIDNPWPFPARIAPTPTVERSVAELLG
ncbi:MULTISPECIES: CocE/NonD family hydrolase [unclassified Modestobacter]